MIQPTQKWALKMIDQMTPAIAAKISKLAYSDSPYSAIPGFNLKRRFSDPVLDTQGLFGVLDQKIFVIAFRGSESWTDLALVDVLMGIRPITPYPKSGTSQETKAHRGFFAAYGLVRPTIHQVIKGSSLDTVLVCGHSLAGALSLICSLDLAINFQDKRIACRTFGAARVGNAVFRESFRKHVGDCVEYQGGLDVVPKLPPWFESVGDVERTGFHRHSLDRYIEALGG